MSNSGEGKDYSDEFRALLKKHNLTQQDAAELITKDSKKRVVARTVRTWLASNNAKQKVVCTEWAYQALERAIKNLIEDKK